MINITSIYQFGTGALTIVPGKTDNMYYIRICALLDGEFGDITKFDETIKDKQSDIIDTILIFPSEDRMLKVFAALANKSFDEIFEKWNKLIH